MKVGSVLSELNFDWYECPLKDSDIEGLKYLRSKLTVPIAAAEAQYTGLSDWTRYLTQGACDYIRGIADVAGGITGLRKMAVVSEAFNTNLESHSFGSTLVMAAHLHVMLAQKNCRWFEMPIPFDLFSKYSLDSVNLDENGYVHAPTKPGLGYDMDWDLIEKSKIRELDGKPLPGEIFNMNLYFYR
jgi:L-alanine-DL-glutamate epimerase-like enolase superfamily enzyme